MSFDPRSLERLRQLGRTLPQHLPPPEPPAPAAAPVAAPKAAPSPADRRRHRLETETDPEALFHELMRTSPDGSAPPHLLERLRELEARRSRSDATEPGTARTPTRSREGKQATGRGSGRAGRRGEQADLYTAFEQLLLEDDEI